MQLESVSVATQEMDADSTKLFLSHPRPPPIPIPIPIPISIVLHLHLHLHLPWYRLYTLMYPADSSMQSQIHYIFQEHLKWGDGIIEAQKPQIVHSLRPSRGSRRLRIGFVSGDFRVHSVSYFIETPLRELDQEKFEVFLYNNFPVKSADSRTRQLKSLLQSPSKHWRDIHGQSTRQVRGSDNAGWGWGWVEMIEPFLFRL